MSERSWLTVLHSCLCYYPQNKQGCIISPCDYMCFSPAQALVMIYSCLCLEEGQMVGWQREVEQTCVCVCDVTWHTAKYGDPYSEFVLCKLTHPKCTHTAVNSHTPWTHTRSSGQPFMLRRPGSSWGFGALLKGTSVGVLKVERALVIHSPHLQLATFGLRVRLFNH